jgi:hypothetical protein
MQMLTRADWGASVPTYYRMTLPAVGVHVHHSVTLVDDDGSPFVHGDVIADMREIEHIGRQRFGRFPYSYCIHPSGGVIAEGAGLTIGAHTSGYNSTTFGFCLIGNYTDVDPTDEQIAAFGEWFRWMVDNGWLRADAWIEPHRARKATACPGDCTIRRWDDLIAATRLPAPPPAPRPQPIDLGSVDMSNVYTKLVSIGPLDGGGNGWDYVDFPFPATRVIGVVPHDAHPIGDDMVPGTPDDRGYNPNVPPRYTAAIYAGRVLVTARDGVPGATHNVWVSAA